MLEKISKILYIFLATLFILLIIIMGIKSNIVLDNKIIYIIILLFLPLLNGLGNIIKNDIRKVNINIKYSNNIIKYFIILLIGIILYFSNVEFNNIFTLLFILFGLLFGIDSKISFFIALVFIIFTPVYLIIGDKKIAEDLSIFAYYFLIIGISFEIIQNLFNKNKVVKKIETDNKNIYLDNLTNNGLSLLEEYTIFLKRKYLEIRNNILIEIGEENRITKLEKNKNNNLFIKLIKYFYKKIILNIKHIFYVLFIINSVLVIFVFKFDLIKILNFSFILLIIVFFYILLFGKEKLINNLNLKNIYSKNYFLNKAIIFSSLGVTTGSFLLNYLNIKNKSFLIFFSIFILFFTVFYFVFFNFEKRKFLKEKKDKIKGISIKGLLIKHIYGLLNLGLISMILISLGIKYNNIENSGQDLKISNKKEKRKNISREKEINKIKKTLISGEIKINKKDEEIEKIVKSLSNGEIKSNNKLKTKQLIRVKEYYKFNRNLRVGSRNNEVKKLEEIMKKLGYFAGKPDKVFNNTTKKSLTNLLKKECNWPESTKGILGHKAQLCLYSLKIEK